MGMMSVESRFVVAVTIFVVAACGPWAAQAQLSNSFYDSSCPNLEATVNSALQSALQVDGSIGASLLRMHFHDCFVQGCDGSVLLIDTPTFFGEQTATPNTGSLRGFDVVGNIKSAVEATCPGTVSCADLLALIARDVVISALGPFWPVGYGRRDSTTACFSCANSDIPGPTDNVAQLTAAFNNKGLSQLDMVTLSGAHTLGKAHCSLFSTRLNNFQGTGLPDPTLNPAYLAALQGECTSGRVEVDLDPTSDFVFDNNYYINLESNSGLLTSDQGLQSEGGSTAAVVGSFAASEIAFYSLFPGSMVNLGALGALTGTNGEIRLNCSVVNGS